MMITHIPSSWLNRPIYSIFSFSFSNALVSRYCTPFKRGEFFFCDMANGYREQKGNSSYLNRLCKSTLHQNFKDLILCPRRVKKSKLQKAFVHLDITYTKHTHNYFSNQLAKPLHFYSTHCRFSKKLFYKSDFN